MFQERPILVCSVTFDHFNHINGKGLSLKSSLFVALAFHLESNKQDTNSVYLQLFPMLLGIPALIWLQ